MYKFQITSEINPAGLEKRFAEDVPLKDLKTKLVLITGVETASMKMELYADEEFKGELSNEDQTIGQAVGDVGDAKQLRLHVKDTSGKSLDLLDEQEIQKYEMSDEAYAKRENSLRSFKMQNKLGRFADK